MQFLQGFITLYTRKIPIWEIPNVLTSISTITPNLLKAILNQLLFVNDDVNSNNYVKVNEDTQPIHIYLNVVTILGWLRTQLVSQRSSSSFGHISKFSTLICECAKHWLGANHIIRIEIEAITSAILINYDLQKYDDINTSASLKAVQQSQQYTQSELDETSKMYVWDSALIHEFESLFEHVFVDSHVILPNMFQTIDGAFSEALTISARTGLSTFEKQWREMYQEWNDESRFRVQSTCRFIERTNCKGISNSLVDYYNNNNNNNNNKNGIYHNNNECSMKWIERGNMIITKIITGWNELSYGSSTDVDMMQQSYDQWRRYLRHCDIIIEYLRCSTWTYGSFAFYQGMDSMVIESINDVQEDYKSSTIPRLSSYIPKTLFHTVRLTNILQSSDDCLWWLYMPFLHLIFPQRHVDIVNESDPFNICLNSSSSSSSTLHEIYLGLFITWCLKLEQFTGSMKYKSRCDDYYSLRITESITYVINASINWRNIRCHPTFATFSKRVSTLLPASESSPVSPISPTSSVSSVSNSFDRQIDSIECKNNDQVNPTNITDLFALFSILLSRRLISKSIITCPTIFPSQFNSLVPRLQFHESWRQKIPEHPLFQSILLEYLNDGTVVDTNTDLFGCTQYMFFKHLSYWRTQPITTLDTPTKSEEEYILSKLLKSESSNVTTLGYTKYYLQLKMYFDHIYGSSCWSTSINTVDFDRFTAWSSSSSSSSLSASSSVLTSAYASPSITTTTTTTNEDSCEDFAFPINEWKRHVHCLLYAITNGINVENQIDTDKNTELTDDKTRYNHIDKMSEYEQFELLVQLCKVAAHRGWTRPSELDNHLMSIHQSEKHLDIVYLLLSCLVYEQESISSKCANEAQNVEEETKETKETKESKETKEKISTIKDSSLPSILPITIRVTMPMPIQITNSPVTTSMATSITRSIATSMTTTGYHPPLTVSSIVELQQIAERTFKEPSFVPIRFANAELIPTQKDDRGGKGKRAPVTWLHLAGRMESLPSGLIVHLEKTIPDIIILLHPWIKSKLSSQLSNDRISPLFVYLMESDSFVDRNISLIHLPGPQTLEFAHDYSNVTNTKLSERLYELQKMKANAPKTSIIIPLTIPTRNYILIRYNAIQETWQIATTYLDNSYLHPDRHIVRY